MALKRIEKELNELKTRPLTFCKASVDKNNLFNWEVTLIGPTNSVYQNGRFKLLLKFPTNYPFQPPKILFITRIFHPNINSNGEAYLDIENNWSPAMSASKILCYIHSLLAVPILDKYMNKDIAEVYLIDRQQYNSKAREWVQKYAI